jgi:hypothetical protein
MWPSTPPPFALIVPRRLKIGGDDIGAGRWAKTWNIEIDIHIVVLNVYDPAYMDTTVVTSSDRDTGPYELVQVLIDKLDQSYISTPAGDYATVEFPRATQVGELRRFRQFEMLIVQILPSTMTVSATPN